MRFIRDTVIVASVLVLAGCAGGGPALRMAKYKRANPWTHLDLLNNPKDFQFAIVADRTGGLRPGVFAEAVDRLNLLKPEFVMSIGDFIEGNTEDQAELTRQWSEFDALVNRLEMPFFYVPGNHDISNEVMARKWYRHRGRSYYHFVYHDVLFLCLNTEDPPKRNISDRQIAYFRGVLRAYRNVRWTLVFMHQPIWTDAEPGNFATLESLLAGRPYTVFAGHNHTYSKSIRQDSRYYTLSLTGGKGGGPQGEPAGIAHCQFDHVVWVTMTDKGPSIANLLLEGILNDEPCAK